MLYRIGRVILKHHHPLTTTASTGLGVAVAFGLRLWVDDWLPPGFPFLTFFPAVILTGFFLGVRAGTASAVLCGLCAWYFFIAPGRSFALPFGAAVAMIFYALVVFTDLLLIHLMRGALRNMSDERARATQLAQTNRLMFHELQHRVSNNLQVIASLLKLQRRNVTDPAAQSALDVAATRLDMVGRVQRRLHDPDRQSVDFAQFLQEMVPEVVEVSAARHDVVIHLETSPLTITSDQSVPLALITAELVANALEHGRDASGKVHLSVRSSITDAGEGVLEVSDQGSGLAEGFDLEKARSLGLRVARQFARQLDGRLSLEPRIGGGTRALVAFPLAVVA